MKFLTPSLLFCAAALFCLALYAAPALAQQKLSDGEDVAFSFFKTAGSNPDFTKWARHSAGYRTAAPSLAAKYLTDEKQRLMRRWQSMREDDRNIHIRMEVPLQLHYEQTGPEEITYSMHMVLPEGDPFYLPYHYRDYNFAVMPDGLQGAAGQPLRKEQFDLIYQDFGESLHGEAYLYILLIPTRAYADRPYDLNGTEQWALITRIGALSLKSRRGGAALWDMTAPWYLSPVRQELNDLYAPADTLSAPVPQSP
ncbi:MAG: hypothetical protein WC989_06670 [Micavibrio sp.]